MVTEINGKLDFILNHFMLDKEGLLSTEKKMVNISASGLKFTVNYHVKVSDIMEVKLLLPTYPPVVVFAYGKVIRAKKLDDSKYEVAIEYINLADDVRNEIIQYTLSHQREELRRSREQGEGE
jgi:c-di-GMP-binding flagellar brake protein YcgR